MTGSRVLNGGTNTGIGRALGRRAFLKSTTIALAGMCAGLGSTVGNRPSAIAAETLKTLRMGYQKYGTLVLLKTMGALEKRLEPLGIAVTWTEFPDGPKLMEAINLGSIDFGTTGDAPPIVAQAAGTPFVYVGHEPPAPKGEAVVVLDGSPIRSVGDLKGKRLAVNRGSNVHYLSLRALAKAGLGVGDVEFVFLPPADGRPAFERGTVDAWAIRDPFLAAIEIDIPVRVIADGASVGVSNYQFYHATRELRERHPAVIAAILKEIATVDESAKQDVPRIAAVLAPAIGMKTEAVERALGRMGFGVRPLDGDVVGEQQRLADAFFAAILIPRKIDVSAVVSTALF